MYDAGLMQSGAGVSLPGARVSLRLDSSAVMYVWELYGDLESKLGLLLICLQLLTYHNNNCPTLAAGHI